MTIYDLSQSFRDDLLANEQAAMRRLVDSYRVAWNTLLPKITKLLDEIAKLEATGQEVTPALVMQLDRYQQLEAQILKERERLDKILYNQVEKSIAMAVPMGADAGAAMLQQIAQNGGIEISLATLDKRTVEAITANLLENSPLTALLQKAAGDGAKRLRDTLIEGVTLGYNARKIGSQMREALGGNLNRALTIARTETLRAYREGTHQTYQANQHLITGWYWTASLSRRTCGACIALHGQFFPSSERQYSHVRCRCTSVPAVKGAPPPFDETGEQWFANQPDDVQSSIIRNRSTMDALRSGELRLRDVVGKQESPTWGPSFVQLGTRRSLAGQGSFPTFAEADGPKSIEEIIQKELGDGSPTLAQISANRRLANFVPAKTIAEAEKWATDNGISFFVNYKKLRIEDANKVNKKLAEIWDTWSLRPLDEIDGRVDQQNVEAKANGRSLLYHKSILKNPKKIKEKFLRTTRDFSSDIKLTVAHHESLMRTTANAKKVLTLRRYAQYQRWYVRTSEDLFVEQVFVHESGHVIQDQLLGMINPWLIQDRHMVGNRRSEMLEKWNKTKNEMTDEEKFSVSAYSSVDSSELFAELFVMYNYENSKMPKRFRIFFDELKEYAKGPVL